MPVYKTIDDIRSWDDLGTRIMVMGPSCVGKSTLAFHLSQHLKTTPTYLDQLAHIEGTKWERKPEAKFSAAQDSVLKEDKWVIEGNYSALMPQRYAKATCVIWMRNDSRIAFLWHYIKRSFFGAKNRCGGLKDAGREFSWELVHYTFGRARRNYQKYIRIFETRNDVPVYIIHSFKDRKKLYKNLNLNQNQDRR